MDGTLRRGENGVVAANYANDANGAQNKSLMRPIRAIGVIRGYAPILLKVSCSCFPERGRDRAGHRPSSASASFSGLPAGSVWEARFVLFSRNPQLGVRRIGRFLDTLSTTNWKYYCTRGLDIDVDIFFRLNAPAEHHIETEHRQQDNDDNGYGSHTTTRVISHGNLLLH